MHFYTFYSVTVDCSHKKIRKSLTPNQTVIMCQFSTSDIL